jgi:deoxyribodipyrimidine photolyase-related protein
MRRWLFADQLGPHHLDERDQPVLLVESRAGRRRSRRTRSSGRPTVAEVLPDRSFATGRDESFVDGYDRVMPGCGGWPTSTRWSSRNGTAAPWRCLQTPAGGA